MLILVKYNSHLLSFNITTTTYNYDLLHFRKKLEDSGFSTLICYKKNIEEKVVRLTNQRRKFKSILDIDLNLITQQCILIYHNDLFDPLFLPGSTGKSSYDVISSFINRCESLNKVVIIQYNNDTEHLFSGVKSDIVYLDDVNIKKSEDQSKLNSVIRELKISRLLS
jgi:hypothetical protein